MENLGKHIYTVGELANLVGVSVRTLQYYDKIGLLSSILSEGGRRTYTNEDILKIQQILFLKSFGFSLEEIKNKILNNKIPGELEQIFSQQREMLLEQIGNLNKIVNMLDTGIAEIKSGKEISLDKLKTIIELMKQGNPYTFVIRYLGDEQIKNVSKRFDSMEEQQIYMKHAKELFELMEELYKKGEDPAGKEGQKLAKLWWQMVEKFTRGDLSLMESLFSAGKDVNNWPLETKNLQDAMQNFLGKALAIYFENNSIQVPGML